MATFVYYTSNSGWQMTVPPAGELLRKYVNGKISARFTRNAGSSVVAASNITLNDDGNDYYIANVASLLVNQLTTLPDETDIIVRFSNTLTIYHNFAATTGFSTVICPGGKPLRIIAGEYVQMLMRSGKWEVYGGSYLFRHRFKKQVKVVD